jgi:hypothetical protein
MLDAPVKPDPEAFAARAWRRIARCVLALATGPAARAGH